MPLRPPEFGYRTTAPARGSTRRWTRPFSASNASGRHEACPVSSTGQRHNPLPSEALRIFAPIICRRGSRPSRMTAMRRHYLMPGSGDGQNDPSARPLQTANQPRLARRTAAMRDGRAALTLSWSC